MWTLLFTAFIVDLVGQDFLDQISIETLLPLISFIANLVVLTVVFYIAGIIVVGKKRALLGDAFVISLLGTIVSSICLIFFPPLIGIILSFVVWLLLIRHYYETGWLGALAVGLLAVIVSIVVLLILGALLGISILLFGELLPLTMFC
jgi:hypothetical protein